MLATVRSLIESALVAGAGGHHDSRVCIPGLHAAEIERRAVRSRIGHGALLPMRAAVYSFENRPAGSAGPGYRSIHRIDTAQAGGRARVLHLPDRLRLSLRLRGRLGYGDD